MRTRANSYIPFQVNVETYNSLGVDSKFIFAAIELQLGWVLNENAGFLTWGACSK